MWPITQCPCSSTSASTGSEPSPIPHPLSALQLEMAVALEKRAVSWQAKLQPFSVPLASVWTTLSFQKSPKALLGAYAAVFIAALGLTLLDGSFFHQLGLFLLLSALLYALLVAGMKSHGISLAEVLDRNQTHGDGAVVKDVSLHLAKLESLVAAAVVNVARVRAQQPVIFYVSGLCAVLILGRVGHWVTFHALLWVSGAVMLAMPVALSRGWVVVPTPEDVSSATAAMRTAIYSRVMNNS